MHNSIINHSAIIGDNCIINTGTIVEHEVNIGATQSFLQVQL